jgi:hypothetical protein
MGRQHRGTTGSAERVAKTGYLCLAIGFRKDHLYNVIIDASHGGEREPRHGISDESDKV